MEADSGSQRLVITPRSLLRSAEWRGRSKTQQPHSGGAHPVQPAEAMMQTGSGTHSQRACAIGVKVLFFCRPALAPPSPRLSLSLLLAGAQVLVAQHTRARTVD